VDPLALAEALGPLPGLFLRLSRGLRGRAAGWSFLTLAEPGGLAPARLPAGKRLAEVLAPLRPREARRHGPQVPFAGGWVGYLGYEARSAVERTPPPRLSPLGFPVVWLAPAPAVLAFDHRRGHAYVASHGSDAHAAKAAAERLLARVTGAAHTTPSAPQGSAAVRPARASAPRPRISAAAYQAAVERVRRYVLDGDLFQANLSQRFDARTTGSPLALFARLVARQPTPHTTCLVLPGGRAVLSASPERFLQVKGRVATTEPMKGTRPRGATPAEDRALKQELLASEKDQAELAMIVDLSRNDLARVSTPGTVRVRAARRLIAFAGVHQAIAVIEGRLAPGKDRVDLLEAAFPPGSVTGAPKVRAMEVIDELEGEGRGPYCGAIGWFDVGGDMDLAVAIRTLLVAGTRASYRVGGGITLRSDAVEEWRETLTKGRALSAALADEPS
jgi:para-aminobenzoate synthetase component 1